VQKTNNSDKVLVNVRLSSSFSAGFVDFRYMDCYNINAVFGNEKIKGTEKGPYGGYVHVNGSCCRNPMGR
jgi:hypothetical protein